MSTQAQEPFQRMILDITGRSSLAECFDAYTALTTVEYTTPRGLKTTATSESLIDTLPYVLTIQLKVGVVIAMQLLMRVSHPIPKRVVYDTQQRMSVKLNHEIKFDDTMFMDRFVVLVCSLNQDFTRA